MKGSVVRAEVVGVLVAVADGTPLVLAQGEPPELPAGPLLDDDPSLQRSTRNWVERHTGHRPGYLEQLYTFADTGRSEQERTVSVSYLGLSAPPSNTSGWRGWYDFFPWEDRRTSPAVGDALLARLGAWADAAASSSERRERRSRVDITFGVGGRAWRPDMVLHRYELLYEAGLVEEAVHRECHGPLAPGERMYRDHRRILATGLARLRAKIEYRPVVFELLFPEFTLRELQRCVEAIAGQQVHTQNFRRFVELQDLVEETGERTTATGGRPAKLYRFRRVVLEERQASGTKLPLVRTK